MGGGLFYFNRYYAHTPSGVKFISISGSTIKIAGIRRYYMMKCRGNNNCYREGVKEEVLEQIMQSSNFNYLPRAMEAANIRQEVIAHNVANVNTPNYKKSNLIFEDLLAKELYGDDTKGKLQLARTRDKHLPAADIPFVAIPSIVTEHQTLMRVDHNNVDIDIEMANLAKNQIYFNALATQMNGYVSKLKNVITSSGQGG